MNEKTENTGLGSIHVAATDEAGTKVTIPVIKEELQVGKKEIEIGKVYITKTVNEHLKTIDIPLLREQYTVERIAVNEYLETPPPPMRYEGEVMVIPVIREELVVQKRLLLVEELRITKTSVQTNEVRQVTIKEEEVTVQRSSTGSAEQ